MSQLLAVAHVLASSARQQIIVVGAHPLLLVVGILHPGILLFVVVVARSDSANEPVMPVATAVLLMAYWGATVWQGAGILRWERNAGTLVAMISGVRDPMLVLSGKSLGASLTPATLATFTTAGVVALMRVPLEVAAPGWFTIGLVAALVSGASLNTLLCSLFLLTRFGPQLSNVLLYPVFLLAGLLIPVELFPVEVRWLGWLVSLRWGQQFLASTTQDDPDFTALGLVGMLTLVYTVAGVAAFRHVCNLIRVRGTLELG